MNHVQKINRTKFVDLKFFYNFHSFIFCCARFNVSKPIKKKRNRKKKKKEKEKKRKKRSNVSMRSWRNGEEISNVSFVLGTLSKMAPVFLQA
jgi:hypothetical protein